MSRQEARLRAFELAEPVLGDAGMPAVLGPSGHRDGMLPRQPAAERLAAHLLTRGRRHEVLEPILAANFKDPQVMWRRETNLSKVLRAQFVRMADIGPLFFFAQDGAEELFELFTWARGVADGVVQRHSAAEWLLLLRRAFLTPADGNAMAPSWFTEAFIRRSVHPTRRPGLVGRSWRASPRTLEDLHDLLLITTMMWNVGRAFRTLSKGLVVSFTNPDTFYPLGVNTDHAILNAIAMFEERQARWSGTTLGHVLHGAGVYGNAFAPQGGEFRNGGAIPAWREHGSGLDLHRYFLRWRTHYWPEFIDPESVFGLNTGLTPDPRALAAAGALWASCVDIGINKARFRLPNGPWLAWGVHRLPRSTLVSALHGWEEIARRFDPGWDAEVGIAELGRSSVELLWIDDRYALALELGSDDVLVDLLGASRALRAGHRRASGGNDANRLTALFERQVQAVIDATPSRPEGRLRDLIGRTIRVDGKVLTDIDALACSEDLLILVDAKAWAVPPTLQFGEFYAVEDRRRMAEEACAEWQKKVQIIRENRARLGLPERIDIAGVVVCPEAPYVVGGSSTTPIGIGLMALSSLAEFEFCLRAASSRNGQSDYSYPYPELGMREVISDLGPQLLRQLRRGSARPPKGDHGAA